MRRFFVRPVKYSRTNALEVRIYRTRKEMHEGVRDAGSTCASDTVANVVDNEGVTPDIAFFSEHVLDVGTVAHELLHATVNIMQRAGKRIEYHEEEYAMMLDGFISDFFRKV